MGAAPLTVRPSPFAVCSSGANETNGTNETDADTAAAAAACAPWCFYYYSWEPSAYLLLRNTKFARISPSLAM